MKKIGIAILVTLTSLSSHALETACFTYLQKGQKMVGRIKMNETKVSINWNLNGTPSKDYTESGTINSGTFQKDRTSGAISGVAYFSESQDSYDANVAISQTGVFFQPKWQNGGPIDPNMKPMPRTSCP
ncbi:MAG: hypothetical protein J0M15_07090 [Deltaproteobacteria bacterium]|nr:hypothetical protein [Deltaproteobacteria bacterium]